MKTQKKLLLSLVAVLVINSLRADNKKNDSMGLASGIAMGTAIGLVVYYTGKAVYEVGQNYYKKPVVEITKEQVEPELTNFFFEEDEPVIEIVAIVVEPALEEKAAQVVAVKKKTFEELLTAAQMATAQKTVDAFKDLFDDSETTGY